MRRFEQRCICSPKIVAPRPKRVGRVGFSLSRALFRKNVGAPHLGRQTLFFLKKTGYLSSNHRLSVVQCHPSLFSPKKLATFFAITVTFIHLLVHSGVAHYFRHAKKFAAALVGAPFCGAPVRPNMLNMPKSAAAS